MQLLKRGFLNSDEGLWTSLWTHAVHTSISSSGGLKLFVQLRACKCSKAVTRQVQPLAMALFGLCNMNWPKTICGSRRIGRTRAAAVPPPAQTWLLLHR